MYKTKEAPTAGATQAQLLGFFRRPVSGGEDVRDAKMTQGMIKPYSGASGSLTWVGVDICGQKQVFVDKNLGSCGQKLGRKIKFRETP